MNSDDAKALIIEKLEESHPRLMGFFPLDDEQISRYINGPDPVVIEEPKEEEHFVGHRKIKLASPADSSSGEEIDPKTIGFVDDPESRKCLKRPP